MNEMYAALIRYGIELLRRGLNQAPGSWLSGRLADLARSMSIGEEVSARLNRARQIVGDTLDESLTPSQAKFRTPDIRGLTI